MWLEFLQVLIWSERCWSKSIFAAYGASALNIRRDVSDNTYKANLLNRIKSKKCSTLVVREVPPILSCVARGGGLIDEYDNEEQPQDEDEFSVYEDSSNDELVDAPRQRPAQKTQPQRPPAIDKRKTTSSVTKTIGALASVMSKTANVITSTAISSVEGTAKFAAPKFVNEGEIHGTWRLDQQVDFGNGPVSCAANVLLSPGGKVTTFYKSKNYYTNYIFKQKHWPRHCTIEMDAFAFQLPSQGEPIRLIYKGSIRRKIMQPSVIKIHGKIYEQASKRGWVGRKPELILVGSFVARRRVTVANQPDLDVSEYEEDYDHDESYDQDECYGEEADLQDESFES